jgi:predicted alpha/beta-hydrolase family hydrolase
LESVEVLSALVEQNPVDLAAKHELAISLRMSGDFEQSLEISEEILQINPSHRPSLLARIDTNVRAQNHSAALACVEDAIARLPDDTMMQLRQGFILRQNQRFDESVAVLSSLVEQNPLDLAAKHELAISLRMIGDYEQSLAISEEILQINPSHRPSLLHGSHYSKNLIVVVGRASAQKPSSSIDKILEELHKIGFSICFFPYNSAKSNSENSDVLSMFLKYISSQSVFIVAHSAGGIISSLSESDAKILKMVCFGYPFKHPNKGKEPERTAHLRKVNRPFLIVQGDSDCYGAKEHAERYELSSSIEILDVTSDHNYSDLSEGDYRRCLDRISDFFGLN